MLAGMVAPVIFRPFLDPRLLITASGRSVLPEAVSFIADRFASPISLGEHFA
jgi:hypothetical protein